MVQIKADMEAHLKAKKKHAQNAVTKNKSISNVTDYERLTEDGDLLFDGEGNKYNGKAIKYYESGNKEFEINVIDGYAQGMMTGFYEDGEKKYELNFVDGKGQGKKNGFYKSGKKYYEVNFIDNLAQGNMTVFYENGNIKEIIIFKDNKLVSNKKESVEEEKRLNAKEETKYSNLLQKEKSKNIKSTEDKWDKYFFGNQWRNFPNHTCDFQGGSYRIYYKSNGVFGSGGKRGREIVLGGTNLSSLEPMRHFYGFRDDGGLNWTGKRYAGGGYNEQIYMIDNNTIKVQSNIQRGNDALWEKDGNVKTLKACTVEINSPAQKQLTKKTGARDNTGINDGIAGTYCNTGRGMLLNPILVMRQQGIPIDSALDVASSFRRDNKRLYGVLRASIYEIYANPAGMEGMLHDGRWYNACVEEVRGY